MKKLLIFSLCLFSIASCGVKDPVSGLNETNKLFLFGDDESKITFLGWPIIGDSPSCNPEDMGQGYSFIKNDDGFIIESIRPSGIEKHKINSIKSFDNKIEIKAKNGANLPFSLILSNISGSNVEISFDNEVNSRFLRCIR